MKTKNLIPKTAKDIATLYTNDGWKFENGITNANGFNSPIYEDFLVLFKESPQSRIYDLYN